MSVSPFCKKGYESVFVFTCNVTTGNSRVKNKTEIEGKFHKNVLNKKSFAEFFSMLAEKKGSEKQNGSNNKITISSADFLPLLQATRFGLEFDLILHVAIEFTCS